MIMRTQIGLKDPSLYLCRVQDLRVGQNDLNY